jgi:hypothetical protein
MQENDVKVGDVVAWDKVPVLSLSRWVTDNAAYFYVRLTADLGWCVGCFIETGAWQRPGRGWSWLERAPEKSSVTIIALGLTGQETASDLQRLAEVFEVREALEAMQDDLPWNHRLNQDEHHLGIDAVAKCLHVAGWRPGMTAEDAARMLETWRVAAAIAMAER